MQTISYKEEIRIARVVLACYSLIKITILPTFPQDMQSVLWKKRLQKKER